MPSVIELPMQSLAQRLAALERDIDGGSYRGGLWQPMLAEIRRLPRDERAALSETVSRISATLHTRKTKSRVPFTLGLTLEVALAVCGAALLSFAVQQRSTAAAIATAIIWTMAFQPLAKILIGSLLGIRYAYAYLLGPEPRFKMRYGTYIAAPRAARIVFHLSGTVGSPIGAWLPIRFLEPELPKAVEFCWVLFGVVVAINAVPFILALAGFVRMGPVRLSLGSAASAALEIREAL